MKTTVATATSKDQFIRERDEGSESEPNIAALGNAGAKCKENLAFAAPNVTASENSKLKYCKFFCNTATVQFYL